MPKATSVLSTPRSNTPNIARKRAVEAVPAIAHEPPCHRPPSHDAALAGSPVADLMRLREEAAAEIDRLLTFLDATEGDIEAEDDADDEECHDFEEIDGRPVLTVACGRQVRL